MIRRGFTLVELLACLCVVGLAAALVAPAFKRNRDVMSYQTSRARLATCAQMQLAYAAAQNNEFYHPWRGQAPTGSWYSFPSAFDPVAFWFFNTREAAYTADVLSAFAYWGVNERQSLKTLLSPVQYSPVDSVVYSANKSVIDPVDDPTQRRWYAINGSFWMTPTLWFDNARYQFLNRANPAANTLRRNKTDDVVYNDSKVLLFDRLGFFDASGNAVPGIAPTWCNPVASPNVAMMDGSVTQAKTAELQALATSQDVSVRAVFTPSGRWRPTTAALSDVGLDNQNLQNSSNWYAFFWGTRNGLAGRDIDRTGLAKDANAQRSRVFKSIQQPLVPQ
jgi:prepilin-type N-terminal cleavage/methylation domain-containing protein